jgi:membrane protease YdiL (CAAX protease family)
MESVWALVIVVGATAIALNLRRIAHDLRNFTPFLPWVLLFSLSNSFSEEVIYRLGVIVPLAGSVDTTYILLVCAIAFGAPHLRGMPNGIAGALMAGLLGWLLAKSVVETGGLFWAWFIHFLQDIVIFSALVMAAATNHLPIKPALARSSRPDPPSRP